MLTPFTAATALLIQGGVLAALSSAMAVAVFEIHRLSGGYLIPDMVFGYDEETLRTMLAAYGPEGQRLYAQVSSLDRFYPFAYGLFMTCLVCRWSDGRLLFGLLYAPLVAALFDYAENDYLQRIMSTYPPLKVELIETASRLTVAKHCTLVLSFAVLAYAVRAAQSRRRKNNQP